MDADCLVKLSLGHASFHGHSKALQSNVVTVSTKLFVDCLVHLPLVSIAFLHSLWGCSLQTHLVQHMGKLADMVYNNPSITIILNCALDCVFKLIAANQRKALHLLLQSFYDNDTARTTLQKQHFSWLVTKQSSNNNRSRVSHACRP